MLRGSGRCTSEGPVLQGIRGCDPDETRSLGKSPCSARGAVCGAPGDALG